MQLKDYYRILKVQPTASMLQIKKSFRQLALTYHPDKNPGNALAEANFREIQEAYETLINPQKREEYNYKRWYSRSIHDTFVQEVLSPDSILRESIRLQDYMKTVNVLRVDFDGLSYHIRELLSETNINILLQEENKNINTKIIETCLQSASVLPYKYIEPIAERLLRIAGNDNNLSEKIFLFMAEQKQKNAWQKYKVLIVLAVTILICLVIYAVSK